MDSLVRASLLVRRGMRRGHGIALCAALGACLVAGYGWATVDAVSVLALSTWILLLASRVRTKVMSTGEAPLVIDIELGMLLAVGLDAALLRFEGGLSGTLSPAVYVLVALVAAFSRAAAGLAVVAWVVLLEAAIRRFTLHESGLGTLATHAGFVAAFALLNFAFLRAEVARIRVTARSKVERELLRL